MTGIMRTVLRYVPDALVPGRSAAERAPDDERVRHGHVGKPVSRLDGAAQGARPGEASRPRCAMRGPAACRRRAFDDRPRPYRRRWRPKAAEAGARCRPGDDPSQRAAAEARRKLFGEGDGGGRQQPAGHAGRPPSTGTARPVAVVLAETQEQADHAAGLVSVTYDERRRPSPTSPWPRPMPHHPRIGAGRAGGARDRRCPERAGRRFTSRRCDLHHAAAQNHNAIELHAATVAWDGRASSPCTTPPR